MIRPSLRLMMVFVGGLPVAAVPAFVDGRLWPSWILFVVAVLFLAVWDGVRALAPGALRIEAGLPALLYIGDRDVARLALRLERWKHPVALQLWFELGECLVPQPNRELRLEPGGAADVELALVPRRRGEAELKAVWLRALGPLGLMQRTWSVPLSERIAVLPNVRAVHREAVRFHGERSNLSGVKIERYIGDGSEFDAMRKFTRGFDSGAIDWKASARHRTLLCKVYRAERNHEVVLAFDTGRLMSEPLEGVPRLDHAINAGLLLGYTCLKTGDRVGLFGFDSEPGIYLPPRPGVRTFPRHRKRTAELDYSTEETNFTRCLMDLMRRLSRRSLVVVFSEFVDSTTAELMVANLGQLAKRHVVLFVALKDPLLLQLTSREPSSMLEVNRAVIGAELMRDRRMVFARLRQAGLHCLDVEASEVSSSLVNRYLEIRRRELV